MDTSLYSLQRAGQTIRLPPKVFRVCLYLLEHRDRVVSREELCAQVWPGQFISHTTPEGVMRVVRQAVGDSGQAQGIIQTGKLSIEPSFLYLTDTRKFCTPGQLRGHGTSGGGSDGIDESVTNPLVACTSAATGGVRELDINAFGAMLELNYTMGKWALS